MPLTEMKGLTEEGILCACGSKFDCWAAYYAHVGDCPILRCCHCLEWIDGTNETEENHVCKHLRWARLRSHLRDDLDTMKEILDHG